MTQQRGQPMNSRRTVPIVTAVLASALAFHVSASITAAQDSSVIVNFGDPTALAGAANQVVVPDEATILKGGTVTFVVNGGGHGIAIYPVAKKTTREDITAQLCPHDPVC